MRKPTILRAFLLLPLAEVALSVPILVHAGISKNDIWVTEANTLNTTIRHGGPHHPFIVSIGPINATDPEGSVPTNRKNSSSTEPHELHVGSRLSARAILSRHVNTDLHRRNGNTSHNGNIPAGHSPHRNSSHGTGSDLSNTNSTREGGNQTASRVTFPLATEVEAATGALPISLINKLSSSNVKVYISGLDSDGKLIMLGQNGNWVYLTASSPQPQPITSDVALSLGAPNSTTTFTLPSYIDSARVWVAVDGLQFFVVTTPNGPGLVEPASANPNDPNSEVNYSFAELSWGADYGIYADITSVDFVGLPLGIQLVESNNSVTSVFGVPSNAAPQLCDQLTAQSRNDSRPWDKLCAYNSNGTLVRVLAPSTFASTQPDAFGRYFSRYVNNVWSYYQNHDLIIDTQNTPGNVTCRVQGDSLQCAGDNRGYAKPNCFDIFGCNTGPFSIQEGDNAVHYAVVPRLCAAFNRATLLVPGGNVQPSLPPVQYYRNENRPPQTRPKNWYSELVHGLEMEGRGYAFSYDDVAPNNALDQSGLVSSTNPRALRIIVGGT